MATIKAQLENIVNDDVQGSTNEIRKVTGEIVKKAWSRMLPGKTDVTEAYTNDVFLHAPDILFEHLAALFNVQVISLPWNSDSPDPDMCLPASL